MRVEAPRANRRLAAFLVAVLCTAAPRSSPAQPLGAATPAPPAVATAEPRAGSAPAAPEPIPVPLVVGSSEEALATIAGLEARARTDAELDRIAEVFSAEERSVGRLSSSAAVPGPAAAGRGVAALEPEIARVERRLAVIDEAAIALAKEFQAGSAELDRLRATWSATAASRDTARAPDRIRARVAEVMARIDEVERARRGYLLRIVDQQERIAAARARLATTSAEVARARRAEDRLLFEAESAPLWRAVRSFPAAHDASRARATARLHARSLSEHFATGGSALAWHLAFAAGLAAMLLTLRRAPGSTPREQAVLRHPLLVAAIAALVLTPLLEPGAPLALFDVGLLLALVPWLVVSRPLVPDRLVRAQLALATLFGVDRVAALLPPHGLVARLMLLATSLAAAGLVAAGLRRRGWASALAGQRGREALRAGLWIALASFALAALANVAGNVTLATRVTRGILSSAMAALLAIGGAGVAEAAAAVALRSAAAQRFRIVALHRDVVERRCVQLARWAAFGLWCWAAALSFRAWGQLRAAATATLDARVVVGSLDVSLGDVVAFGVTLWIAIVLARLLRFLLDEAVLPSFALPRGMPGAISKTVQYGVVALGTLAALYASRIELSRFSFFAGTLGVGIGFGLQNVVNNFVSGLILLYERPVQPGDIVDVGAVSGEVRRIGVRSSTVRTFQGADVIVPNGTLIAAEVVNWTLTDRTRRAEVKVSVAYGSDPAAVKRILLAAVDRRDVRRDPQPVVLLTGFGESAIDFEVRFWPEQFDEWVVVASEVRETVLRELARAGIAIPFPQRDLHVRTPQPAVTDLREVARAVSVNPASAATRDRSPAE